MFYVLKGKEKTELSSVSVHRKIKTPVSPILHIRKQERSAYNSAHIYSFLSLIKHTLLLSTKFNRGRMFCMNSIFAISATKISEHRFVSGVADVQTDDTCGSIYFQVDVLGETVNVYTGFEVSGLEHLLDYINDMIDAYAQMYWVSQYYPEQAAPFMDSYHDAVHEFLAEVNN